MKNFSCPLYPRLPRWAGPCKTSALLIILLLCNSFTLAGMALAQRPLDERVTDESVTALGLRLQAEFSAHQPHVWGERLPGIKRTFSTPPDSPTTLALTLDACGGHRNASVDMSILALLRHEGIPATIFVSSLWLRINPQLAAELAADPLFELAGHGLRHKPASVNGRAVFGIRGTASIPDLVEEVEANARHIQALTGTKPLWFRSGTAYYDDVAVMVIGRLGYRIAGYALSADEGAALSAPEVARRLRSALGGSVILCHLNHPESGTGAGLALALPGLKKAGVRFVRLSDIDSWN